MCGESEIIGGEIAIDPPISWESIETSRYLNDDIRECEDDDNDGNGSHLTFVLDEQRAAANLVSRWGTIAHDDIVEDLQALADTFPGHQFPGYFQHETGDGLMSRIWLDQPSRKVRTSEAVTTWPGFPGETALSPDDLAGDES